MIEKLSFIFLPILITALLTSIITRKHKERERLVGAKDRFREIIVKEISRFHNREMDFSQGGNSHLDILYTGILEFKFVLSSVKQKELIDLWQKYKEHGEPEVDWWTCKFNSYVVQETLEYLNKFLSFTK